MSIPVYKTLDEIRTELFEQIGFVQEDYQKKGWLPQILNLNKGVVRGMIELWAWGLFQLYQFLALVLKQAFPSSATGLWLELHCKQVGVEKLKKTKAKGLIYLARTETSGNVPVAAGRVVKTLPDILGNTYSFVTLEDVVLPDGASEIAVAAEAVEYGSGSNVTAGQITEIVTHIPGVDSVENRSDWLTAEGTDDEEDEPLRERYVLAWSEQDGCTKHAYESWTRSVSGVSSVMIMDQHPRGQGTVDVVVLGSAGIPTQGLLDVVSVVVEEKKPINDDVEVKAPLQKLIDINCAIELTGGLPADIKTEVEQAIRSFFSYSGDDFLQISQDVMLSKLTAIVMGASKYIKKVTFTSPAADTIVAGNELAILNSFTISHTLTTEL